MLKKNSNPVGIGVITNVHICRYANQIFPALGYFQKWKLPNG
jgi:hypothetical protein